MLRVQKVGGSIPSWVRSKYWKIDTCCFPT